MMRIRSSFGIVTAMVGFLPVCKAEDITVRVISVKNGRPIVEAHVQLVVVRSKHAPDERSSFLFNDWRYTDGSGLARFHIEAPIPLGVSLGVGGICSDYCSPVTYRANEVLQKGVSIANPRSYPHRSVKKFVVSPRPGEIVIYCGEYSRWERTLYFPWPS